MKSYKQLTYEQRCQIYVLKQSNLAQQAIGMTLKAGGNKEGVALRAFISKAEWLSFASQW